jgi:hypothetical protein
MTNIDNTHIYKGISFSPFRLSSTNYKLGITHCNLYWFVLYKEIVYHIYTVAELRKNDAPGHSTNITIYYSSFNFSHFRVLIFKTI